jgi:hypothetical protein
MLRRGVPKSVGCRDRDSAAGNILMNKRTNKSITSGKSLNLTKETVRHLSASLLKDVKGGYPPDTGATHCESRCKC